MRSRCDLGAGEELLKTVVVRHGYDYCSMLQSEV